MQLRLLAWILLLVPVLAQVSLCPDHTSLLSSFQPDKLLLELSTQLLLRTPSRSRSWSLSLRRLRAQCEQRWTLAPATSMLLP